MMTPYSTLIKDRRITLVGFAGNSFNTQTMAKKFGMSPKDYAAIENGRMKPSLAVALKIGITLGISMHDAKEAFDKS